MISIVKSFLLFLLMDFFHVRRKPRTLQLPITSRCNSRCLTCNIWNQKEKKDIDSVALKKIFRQSFFSKVSTVGINGGEPTLHPNFVDVIESVLSLPKLGHIFLISNCVNSNKLLSSLEIIYPLCKQKGVKLHLQLSIDGVGEIHNTIRGINKSFDNTLCTLEELCNNHYKYVDEFNIGTTISKYNVDYLIQIQEYFSSFNVPVYYHLAVPNKRIHNFTDASFSVLSDKHALQMAREFFYARSISEKSRKERIRCCLIYLYLSGYTRKRMFKCDYLYQDVTISENLDIYLCATASEKVGNLVKELPTYSHLNKLAKETKIHCNQCIHYANVPNMRGYLAFIKYRLITYNWLKKYR